ncbi:phage tail protein E' [Escherichia coli]|nr:phage tail protein E' [Escherichia coli]
MSMCPEDFFKTVTGGSRFFASLVSEEGAGGGRRVTLLAFDYVEDIVADIAVVFHWSPSEIFVMTPGELVAWRERAAVRTGNHNDE